MTDSNTAADRYINLAAERFATQGFHGVSLAAIAQDAGVSKQALLHFFGTKERLYGAVLRDLSTRLLADIEAAEAATPESHVMTYVTRHLTGQASHLRDARLVVRALLDADARAQDWPLKPYLDRLVALLKSTRHWQHATDEAALAAIYQVVGLVQYVAISGPVIEGMYGETALEDIQSAHARQLQQIAALLVGETASGDAVSSGAGAQ